MMSVAAAVMPRSGIREVMDPVLQRRLGGWIGVVTQPAPPVERIGGSLWAVLLAQPGERRLEVPEEARQYDVQELPDLWHAETGETAPPHRRCRPFMKASGSSDSVIWWYFPRSLVILERAMPTSPLASSKSSLIVQPRHSVQAMSASVIVGGRIGKAWTQRAHASSRTLCHLRQKPRQ